MSDSVMHDAGFWRENLAPYTVKSNSTGAAQVLLTLIPFSMIWAAYAYCSTISYWFAVPFAGALALFLLRCFVLMHDCGHGTLFDSKRANAFVGYLLGVITGMPQYVWSKNHKFHHNTNGDWVRYGGVFNIITTDKYATLTKKQQRNYWLFRQPLILLPAGFFYVLFNPRFNWFLGTCMMVVKIVKPLLMLNPSASIAAAKKWETKYWKGKKDYLHMTYTNLALFTIWIVMSYAIGAVPFFLLYVLSTSLSGSLGILTFTIQHNFDGAYATDTEQVCHYRAAIEGTSMLVLPKVLNWFTADIAYHHLHHLSVNIPNYQLAACHNKFEHLFVDVKRVYLSDVLGTFNFQLWDPSKKKVVARPA